MAKQPRKPILSQDQAVAWEEWLAHPLSRRLLSLLKHRSDRMQAEWSRAVWGSQDPQLGNLPEVRAQSIVYRQLSELNLQTLEALLDDEPEHDRD